jgi:hypothetical protein
LIAEMRFPGEATLEFEIYSRNDQHSEIRQWSRYLPRGVSGLIYWYALYPFHRWVFRTMLIGLSRAVGKPIVQGPERIYTR